MSEPGRPRGMILAAGYGTRLAPVTDHLPKPLLPVPGGTLLDRAIAALDNAGVGEIAVNTHHLAPRITAHLAARPDHERFTICHEPEILGTGGALDGAREFLAAAPGFLLHNGDVLAEVDLAALWRAHAGNGALATLVLVDWPDINSVQVDGDGAVVSIAGQPRARDGRHLTYAGIGAFDRSLLADIGPGFSSLIQPLVRALAARPGSVRAWLPTGPGWSDLGTLPRWLETVAGAGIVTGGEASLVPLAGHGSDRRFWRLDTGDWSAVVMQSPPEDTEFARGVAIGRFLADRDLGAPVVLDVHDEQHVLLVEDVGTADLLTVSPAERPGVYADVVDHLLRLQDATSEACPEAVDRTLDRSQLTWETDYFREHFLQGHWHLDTRTLAPLEAEFAALGTAVADQPRVLIHRDFQSGNILVQDGRVRLVDVQGMRLGPLGYDLASLVWDPYIDLGADLRTGLVARFARAAGPRHNLESGVVAGMVRLAALQRLMQALGAYGFLGHVKGKPEFLTHIPRGVIHLRAALAAARGDLALPVLESLFADPGADPS